MAQLRVDLIADDSQFKGKILSAAQEVSSLDAQAQKNGQAVDKLVLSLTNASQLTGGYKRKLMELLLLIQDLTINYRSLTAEERNSEFGRKMYLNMVDLTKQAANLKDGIVDARAAISALASDSANIDAMKQGIDMFKNTMQATVSVMSLMGNNTEDLANAMKMLMTIETVANSAISLRNALGGQLIFILKVRNALTRLAAIAENIHTAAVNKGKTATIAATAALKAFNLIAKANPYVLIATALAAAVGGIIMYTKHLKSAREEEERSKRVKEELKRQQEKNNLFYSSMGQAVGSVVGKFQQLVLAYRRLLSTAELMKFIRDHASDFNLLGLNIKSISDAERVFVNDTLKFIRAMSLRAQSMALLSQQTKLYEEYYEALYKYENEKTLDNGGYSKVVRKGSYKDYTDEEARRAGIRTVSERRSAGTVVSSIGGGYSYLKEDDLTADEIKKLNEYYKQDAKERRDLPKKILEKKEAWILAMQEAIRRAYDKLGIGDTVNFDGSGESGDSGKGDSGKGSSDKDKVQIKDFDVNITGLDPETVKKQVEDLIKTGHRPSIIVEMDKEGTMKNLDELMDEADQEIKNNYAEINLKYDENTFDLFKEEVEESTLTVEKLEEKLSHLNDLLNNIDWSKPEEAKLKFINITAEIEKTKAQLEEILSLLAGKKFNWEGFESMKNDFTEVGYAVDGVVLSIATLSEKNKDMLMFATISSGIAQLIPQIFEATKAFIALAVAESAADGAKSSWITALAATAAVAATILSTIGRVKKEAKKFAQGGIVPGSSYTGDLVIARVNSGEMILNRDLLKNLFNILSGAGFSNGSNNEIRLRIQGEDLIGVMKNYNRIKSKR